MNRATAVNAAASASISARNLCGSEAEAIADTAADYGLTFTSAERAEIAIKVTAVWAEAQTQAGVTRFSRASDYRTLS